MILHGLVVLAILGFLFKYTCTRFVCLLIFYTLLMAFFISLSRDIFGVIGGFAMMMYIMKEFECMRFIK